MINEHSSNPDRPRQLGKFSLRTDRLLRQRRRSVVHSMPVLFGLEVSLLPSGGTDMTDKLAEHCAMVIASRHRLPKETEHDAAAIMTMFKQACLNPTIDVLGHPFRNIWSVKEVNWKLVFAQAASTGTVIEVNFNLFLQDLRNPEATKFWREWLRLLGQSRVKVLVGVDLHNKSQVQRLTDQWLAFNGPNVVPNELWQFLQALTEAGIGPERTVTAHYAGFQEWLRIDKVARSQVLLA